VWLYHGTTSAFLPRILREGLVPGKDARPPRKRLLGLRANLADRGGQIRFQPYVFLTADDSGRAASAGWYARQAAHVHGGDPVVLRVIVPYDALAPDPDDADIRSGRYQFVIDHVPPETIREVDGVQRGKTR
jgi:RNA:NAD 2'-phosphotransferase (TPT1/KptA family)